METFRNHHRNLSPSAWRLLLALLALWVSVGRGQDIQAQIDDRDANGNFSIFKQRSIDILIQTDPKLHANNNSVPEELAKQISKVKGVKRVDYTLIDSVLMDSQDHTLLSVSLIGMPPESWS